MTRVCLNCDGTGIVKDNILNKIHCPVCDGTGRERKLTPREKCDAYTGIGNCGEKGCHGHGDF